MQNQDISTADAFANSWNNLPAGSIYTRDQFEDWMAPLKSDDIAGKSVLELGCGNASLLVHMIRWSPAYLEGVDLGGSIISANKNMQDASEGLSVNWNIKKEDLVSYRSGGFDVVYCIGVLHHLKDPYAGFESVLCNTKSGGRFHCWVYAREGNAVVRYIVDPIRKIVSRLPWWFTKYCVAAPLAVPFYLYAKVNFALPGITVRFPLHEYCLWIAKRDFNFFRHVAFDQLVTPQTTYISKAQIERWLNNDSIKAGSAYIIFRNGNSWKFGGQKS